MTKWRITKITRREGTVKETTTYLVEKRLKKGFLDFFGGMIRLMTVCILMGILTHWLKQ